ncbi:hypothetical protein CBR_g8882 [Chara braunii]|uniref:EF-hand domain-containing protein n=1 Tax=Chara braunii TaxID=69332 RepID=A0A388KN60_CHABU|nr:hypothetical protein CBR_g8882 [Chara braunii]|eukprot:GBG71465.1 hypothetical protein CBR_g8882 [Chara braunii]
MFSRLSGSFGAGSHQPPPPPSPSRRGEYLQPGGGAPYGVPPPRGLQPSYGSPRGSGGYSNPSGARPAHAGAAPGYGPGPAAAAGYQYAAYGGRYSSSGGEYGGSTQYGGRGSYANGAYPQGIDPEYVSWFRAADQDQSGRVDARELQAVLSHSPYEPFNMRTIELMMELFDRRRVGTIGMFRFPFGF